ncbi:MAG: orotidine 5'-phosphate decarboxylase [Proteobacteria bacterium]|nr:orotidine 5'-phosphate decarboxylase [Pseudomonadota bacterium]
MEARLRLIVPLDVATESDALKIVDALGQSVGFYKVGMQLFSVAGSNLVRRLTDSGKKVFLDFRLHEIPSSVTGATKSAADLGVSILAVHASGGRK